MKKTFCIFLLQTLLLGGCTLFHAYQPDVQQGNLISEASVQKIKPGMSKAQVQALMGLPVLSNAFDENHWAYVYTFQHNGGAMTRKNIDIYFNNNRVVRVNTA